MKKRLISVLLALVTVLSACALTLTGCAEKDEEESGTSSKNLATTLVMWCVTEDGTDEAQAKAVAEKMSEYTKAKLKTKLIVKFFTIDEYFDKLEEALTAQETAKLEADEAAKRAKEQAQLYKSKKMTKEEEEAYEAEQALLKAAEEEKKRREEEEHKKIESDGKIKFDENGNPIIDKTVYPDVEDYQVDILYLSGAAKYKAYIEKKWLAAMNSELSIGSNRNIANFVPAALLNAVKVNGTTYAIPNNNVIGQYTYMMVNKELCDRYYYTGYLKAGKYSSIVDLADYLEDIANQEKDVLPIDGNVDYCLSLIADYWDINPDTMKVTGEFSILGNMRDSETKINRGDTAFKFDALFANKTYRDTLASLMAFKYNGYFGTPTEGQKCAVKFVSGDASIVKEYEKDYYPIVVDYPRASEEDIYSNMYAISAYSSNVAKSMEIITLLDTNAEFRNLFLYGIEGVNYTKNSDGSVARKATNRYNMSLSRTGNEFIAYIPEGTDVEIWEYSKKQNREALISPLLDFDLTDELIDESEMPNDPDEKAKNAYAIEIIDTELVQYIYQKSREAWEAIQACQDSEELSTLLSKLSADLSTKDAKIKKATTYEIIEPEMEVDPDSYDNRVIKLIEAKDENGNVIVDKNNRPVMILDERTIPTTAVVVVATEEVKKDDKTVWVPIVSDANIVVTGTAGFRVQTVKHDYDAESDTTGSREEWVKKLVGSLVTGDKLDGLVEIIISTGKTTTEQDGTTTFSVEVPEVATYMILTKTLNPYQLYYRWMNKYGYLPGNFEPKLD